MVLTSTAVGRREDWGGFSKPPHHLPSPTVGPGNINMPRIVQPQRPDRGLSWSLCTAFQQHALLVPGSAETQRRALGREPVGRRPSHGKAGRFPGHRPRGSETEWKKAGCPGSQGLSGEPRNSPEGRSLTQQTARTGWEGRDPGALGPSPEAGKAGPCWSE